MGLVFFSGEKWLCAGQVVFIPRTSTAFFSVGCPSVRFQWDEYDDRSWRLCRNWVN